jgi:hypothetical protein
MRLNQVFHPTVQNLAELKEGNRRSAIDVSLSLLEQLNLGQSNSRL